MDSDTKKWQNIIIQIQLRKLFTSLYKTHLNREAQLLLYFYFCFT